MDKNYEALKDFEAPGNGGAITRGQPLSLCSKLGDLWAKAGLVKEIKSSVPKEVKEVREVKADGN